MFDIIRFPTMDDSPPKPIRKFWFHVYYMTNAINTFCCRRFDFFCMQISYDGRQSCKTHTRIQTSCLLHDKCDQCFLLPSLWLLTLEDSLRWTTVLQSSYENSDFMFVIWQIGSILSIVFTLTFNASRLPTMDDSPAKHIRKFRFHVYSMTNAINTFCCRCFDFFCMQISYDGRQSCKTHTKIQISCSLHDKCDQYFLLPSLWLLTLEDSLRWTTILRST